MVERVQARTYDAKRKESMLSVLEVEFPKNFIQNLLQVSGDPWADAEMDSVVRWAQMACRGMSEKL